MAEVYNIDKEAIKQLLPHRDPFLFVDKIDKATPEFVVGEYTFTPESYFFKGHFPEYPVVPGVILVETMAQCGGAGLRAAIDSKEPCIFLLGTASNCKFRNQVRPGDTVRSEIATSKVSKKIIKQSGKLFVGEVLCAEAEWTCFIVQNETKTEE